MAPTNPTLDDVLDQAIRRVQAGDADAYAQVVRICAPRVRSWVSLRAPSGIDPDEVAHQVFITAFARIEVFQPGTQFQAWLIGFARNILLNECRTAKRRLAHIKHFTDVAWLAVDERELDVDDTEPERRLAALRDCLGGLGEPARELIALRYTEDLPLQRIAQQLSRSVGAIAKSLHLLRRRLHDCITVRLNAAGAQA